MTDDPKLIWLDQPREGPEMGLEHVRAKLRAYEARALRARVIIAATALAAVGVLAAVAFAPLEGAGLVGRILMMTGILVTMALAWRRASARPSGDDAVATLAFLRASLLRRRRAASGGWVWMLAPILPGTVVTLAALASAAGSQWWPRMAPIIGWCLLWLALTLVNQWREGAKVSAELVELDRLDLAQANRGPSA